MVRQVFTGEFRQSKGFFGFDFGICLFYLFDKGEERGEVRWSGMPGMKNLRASLFLV